MKKIKLRYIFFASIALGKHLETELFWKFERMRERIGKTND